MNASADLQTSTEKQITYHITKPKRFFLFNFRLLDAWSFLSVAHRSLSRWRWDAIAESSFGRVQLGNVCSLYIVRRLLPPLSECVWEKTSTLAGYQKNINKSDFIFRPDSLSFYWRNYDYASHRVAERPRRSSEHYTFSVSMSNMSSISRSTVLTAWDGTHTPVRYDLSRSCLR